MHEVNYLTKPIFEMHEFPEYLAARGHDIYFLQFPEGASSAERSGQAWKTTIAGRAVPGSKVTLLSSKLLASGILGRLIYAAMAHSIIRRAILESLPDVIVTLAVPTLGWQAVQVAKKARIPIVYRALDVSHLIRGGVFGPLVKIAETFVIRRASFISSNNQAMANYVSELGARPESVEVHFPPMALEKYRTGARERGRRAINVGDSDNLILYMGTFFYFSGLQEVVQEFARVAPPRSTKLVLVGGGELDAELRNLVTDLGMEDQILFTGFVGFNEVPDYLAAADVFINPMKPSLVSHTALPNKVIQYLAACKTVVSTSLKGVVMTFEGYQGLHLVESSQQCISKAISLVQEPKDDDLSSNLALLYQTFGPSAVDEFGAFLELAVSGK